jgi:PIN domain nuclease of toxin-antitoxin system
MRYITDTHTLVWYFTSDQRLDKNVITIFDSDHSEAEDRWITM